MLRPKLEPASAYAGMWRVQWPDGGLSDITNLTRAQDAVACFMETEERRQRGLQSLSGGRRCVEKGNGCPAAITKSDSALMNRLELGPTRAKP